MFEKEAKEYGDNYVKSKYMETVDETWRKGAEFGYNKGKNEAIKHLRDLVYVVELGKNELATARIVAEAKKFLKETK